MEISRRQATIGGVTLLAGTSMGTSAHAERARLLTRPIKDGEELVVEKFRDAESLTPKDLASRTVYRRAVDAVIWGVPAVTLDMMRQAYFRDAKASYNDIVWWPKGAGWQNQSLDVDTSVRYLFIFSNTEKDGPMVLDLPTGDASSKFLGTILDSWQVPLVDIGVGGKGGKYLILPPDHKGDEPTGYIPLRLKTYGSYMLIRSILASRSEADVRAGDALVKQIRIYPLSVRRQII